MERTYIAIDLKSFYASVECVERNLDPLTTNLVVADTARSEKTICLAVSPTLKQFGIPGRARLFEVVQKVRGVNSLRKSKIYSKDFLGSSVSAIELQNNPSLKLDYIAAPPRMALYIKYSAKIYAIYLKYIAPEDIHVYSIDEVFIDATSYLSLYKTLANDLAMKIIKDILATTGITATAGIGTNLYLAKIAMDIVAKHTEANKDGVRIAYLDEQLYRKLLWNHTPLTDFWRIGKGYSEKLHAMGLNTMGDIARCSIQGSSSYFNADRLFKTFGINAELLIDHAWGFENCTIKDIKSYCPHSSSISTGQVLTCPYSFEKTKIVVREMAESLALDLFAKNLVTDQLYLFLVYDSENVGKASYLFEDNAEIVQDSYGRLFPKPVQGHCNLNNHTASLSVIGKAIEKIFLQIANKNLTVRKISIGANHLMGQREYHLIAQRELFVLNENDIDEEKDLKIQSAVVSIQQKFGKNALIKGLSLQDGAMQIQRNSQIGGHKA